MQRLGGDVFAPMNDYLSQIAVSTANLPTDIAAPIATAVANNGNAAVLVGIAVLARRGGGAARQNGAGERRTEAVLLDQISRLIASGNASAGSLWSEHRSAAHRYSNYGFLGAVEGRRLMALNLTKYGRKAMFDHMFGRGAHSFPTNRYLALFTADPTAEGTLTNEVAVGGYARVEISDLMGDADLALKQIANAFDIIFPPVSSAVSAISAHMGVMDVATRRRRQHAVSRAAGNTADPCRGRAI